MITTDELKVQLADYGTAVKDLEEALAIDASRKRVQELEHTMSRPGFYDDAELSKKVFDDLSITFCQIFYFNCTHMLISLQ